MDGSREQARTHGHETNGQALADTGFALAEMRGDGPFRLAARPAFGLWHQNEGTGTLVCPRAGPLSVAPGTLVLHDCAVGAHGEQAAGGRAVHVEFGPTLLRQVALMEFGADAPLTLDRARLLDDPTLAEMARTMWRVGGREGTNADPPGDGPLADGPLASGARADRATLTVLGWALTTRLVGHHLIEPDRRGLDTRLARVLRHVEENIDSSLRLRVLADVAGLSTYHFSRVFSRRVGRTLQAYVRERRVERARKLLAGGDLPLAEVAFACGFAHQSHFTATFRAATGETPGAYRERSGGGAAPLALPPTTLAEPEPLPDGDG